MRFWKVLIFLLCAAGASADETSGPTNATQVITRFVEALGGKDGIRSVTNYHARGGFELITPHLIGSFEVYQAQPDKQFFRVDLPESGIHDRGFDGAVRWSFNPRPGYRRGKDWVFQTSQGLMLETNKTGVPINEALDLFATLHEGPAFEKIEFLGRTNYDGKAVHQIRLDRPARPVLEYFEADSGLRLAMEFGPTNALETIEFHEYKQFGPCKFPVKVSRKEKGILRDAFTINRVDFDDVPSGRFSMPIHLPQWPADWHGIDEAYPPGFAKNRPWPWHGEHHRWFNEGFPKKDDPFFWSYVVFNTLEGDTLREPGEIRSALWRYDSSLYGDAYPPEKIEVLIQDSSQEKRAGHTVTVYSVEIHGFDAEASKQELTTHLQVYRWFCPKAERTAFLILRSPKKFQQDDAVWRTLLSFYENMVCH